MDTDSDTDSDTNRHAQFDRLGEHELQGTEEANVEEIDAAEVGRIEKADLDELSLSNPCYSASMDSVREILMSRVVTPNLSNRQEFLQHRVYSFKGFRKHYDTYHLSNFQQSLEQMDRYRNADINIYHLMKDLELFRRCAEFSTLWDHLEFAPNVGWLYSRNLHGLGRRIGHVDPSKAPQTAAAKSQSYYDIWFQAPVSWLQYAQAPDMDQPDGLNPRNHFLSELKTAPKKSNALFYMKYNWSSKQVKVFVSPSWRKIDKFVKCCESAASLNVRSDPFVFVCCALSQIVDTWAAQTHFLNPYISRCVHDSLSYPSELTAEQADSVKEKILELRMMVPFLIQQIDCFGCLEHILEDAIVEHGELRQKLDVPDHVFIRVQTDLKTLLSWVKSISAKQRVNQEMIDTSLSTLAFLLTLSNDVAVNENTASMKASARATEANTETTKIMAENGREESVATGNTAQATKLSSEVMKAISLLTVLSLPSIFVVTVEIFDFGFNNGGSGPLIISYLLWVCVAMTIVLTLGIFAGFHVVRDGQKKANKKQVADNMKTKI